jgi:glycosyltransferase involved in cell wall biosynthesis
MTGGLQEQVTDGENWFGIGLNPTSQSVIGSQQVPFIREDRINKEEFIDALLTIYNMSPADRAALGKEGRKHVMTNYNFEDFKKTWVEEMLHIHEKYGSRETRKNYTRWECKEVK